MKRLFALLTFQLSLCCSYSQTHFITAGQTQGMIFTDYVPDYPIAAGCLPSWQIDTSDLYLDINRDAIDDFRIHATGRCTTGGVYYSQTIFPLNLNSVLTKIDTERCGPSVSCPKPLILAAKKILFGDTLINIIDTAWHNDKGLIQEYSYGGGMGYYDTDNSIAEDTPHYYFLKIITSSDTLLGYLHFNNVGKSGGIVFDFACEGPTSSYVISSVNDLSSPNISISPNPFTNQINISIGKPFEYQLTDYTGRIVLSGKAEHNIATGDVARGCYLLTIKNEETFSVKKMVKQ